MRTLNARRLRNSHNWIENDQEMAAKPCFGGVFCFGMDVATWWARSSMIANERTAEKECKQILRMVCEAHWKVLCGC